MDHKHRYIHVGKNRHVPVHGKGFKRHVTFGHDSYSQGGAIRSSSTNSHGVHSGAHVVVHSEGGQLFHSLKFHNGGRKNIHFQY